MTIREGMNEIREAIRIHNITDMASLDNRLIVTWMNDQRAIWLKNDYNKGKSIEDNVRQTINGLELQVVDGSTFDLLRTNHRILKTKQTLPKTIELSYSDGILAVRNSILNSIKYNYIHRDKVPYQGNGRFNKQDIFTFLYNQHMYIVIPAENRKVGMLTHISVEGIFEDPREIYEMGRPAIMPNYEVLDEQYPISKSMWAYIKSMITEVNVKQFVLKEETNVSTNK